MEDKIIQVKHFVRPVVLHMSKDLKNAMSDQYLREALFRIFSLGFLFSLFYPTRSIYLLLIFILSTIYTTYANIAFFESDRKSGEKISYLITKIISSLYIFVDFNFFQLPLLLFIFDVCNILQGEEIYTKKLFVRLRDVVKLHLKNYVKGCPLFEEYSSGKEEEKKKE